jgi:hypothetical protein
VIADDRRQMDRNTFSEVVNAFGHVPRDVSPKHGPQPEGTTTEPDYTLTGGPQFVDQPIEDTDTTGEQPEEKDGTPKTRSTRRTPASPDVPANLRV